MLDVIQLKVIMVSIIMLIVALLNAVMLSVTMLCGVIQSVGYANGQYTELLLDDNHSKCR